MKLILEIMPHTGDEQPVHRTLENFPVTVGRAFDNDIIITDPHVSAHHLKIEFDGKTLQVSDLGSDNGLGVNAAEPVHNKRVTAQSGDTLHIGQTELRLFLPQHPVPAAERLHKSHPAFAWFSHPLHMWGSLVLATALMTGWAYLEVWADDMGVTLAAAVGGAVGTIILWATLWSVAGRLIRHKSHFMSHATMASLYLVAGIVGWYVESYADFLLNENWFSRLVTYGVNFVLLGFLVYGGLAMASRMTWARRRTVAALFSAGVMGGVFILNLVATRSFNQQPIYADTLEPYLSQAAPADTIHTFMLDDDRLFKPE